MITRRPPAELAARYFADDTLKCWVRNKYSNDNWIPNHSPSFNALGLEYYVGHEPPPIKRTTALCRLKELVAALDETYWSSWQSTAQFHNQLTHARSFLAELEGRDE